MLKGMKQVGRAKAIYTYSAIKDDELSLKPGDMINVYKTDLPDQGWWLGELNGSIGVFPENFVRLLSESGDRQHQGDDFPCVTPDHGRIASSRPNVPSQPKVNVLNKPKFHAVSHKTKDPHFQNAPSLSEGMEGFDFIKSSSKLAHITANRVRGPTRRPPSRQPDHPGKAAIQSIAELDSCWGVGRESEFQESETNPGKISPPAGKYAGIRKPLQQKRVVEDVGRTGNSPKQPEVSHSEAVSASVNTVSLEEYEAMQRELQALRGDLKEQMQTNERMVQTLKNFLQEEREKIKVLSAEFSKIKKSVVSKITFL